MTNAGTVVGGGVFWPGYSFSVTDSEEYDIKTKLFISGWFDWYMVSIPSDGCFAYNSRLFQKWTFSRFHNFLLKAFIKIHILIYFGENTSESFQGNCVNHLSCFKYFFWPQLFEFLRCLWAKIDDYRQGSISCYSHWKKKIHQLFVVVIIFKSIVMRLFASEIMKSEYFKLVNWSREVGYGEAFLLTIQRCGFRDHGLQKFHQRFLIFVNHV